MKKTIILGATSGMGKALALKLAGENYSVGITGRREGLLHELAARHPDKFIPMVIDISDPFTPSKLEQMVQVMGGLDLLILAAGIGIPYEPLNSSVTQQIIRTNVMGFTLVIDWAVDYFLKKGSGHLVSFSSIAGIRGCGIDPAYCASNAFKMNYLEGVRQLIDKTNHSVHLTDIRPGFIEKPDTKIENRFWIYSMDKATEQIYRSILDKKRVVYISRRWGAVATMMNMIPGNIYSRLMSPYIKPNGYGKKKVVSQ